MSIAPGGAGMRRGRVEGARDLPASVGGRAAKTDCGEKGGGFVLLLSSVLG